VPVSYHQAALATVGDCGSYLDEIRRGPADNESQHVSRELQRVESALEGFGRFLAALLPLPYERFFVAGVERNLREVLLCPRSLAESLR
jgi:hypothetical protein